jgi:methylglutaconyl-CoA hydratase
MLALTVGKMSYEEARNHTAQTIAGLRVSDEGQEGLRAFLEKRKPHWTQTK